ncbi:MAG: nuclear transport factor 2 family protein [Alphaproteobacteria bacterium]
MTFTQLISQFTQVIVRGDGAAAGNCFTADGVYHDCFYGAFEGRELIGQMIKNYFHRDGGDFIWDVHDPVDDGKTGYALYVFSYASKLGEAKGRRSVFEGVSICRMKDGLLCEYREVANAAVRLHLIDFLPERLAKLIGREAKELVERDESAHHVKQARRSE